MIFDLFNNLEEGGSRQQGFYNNEVEKEEEEWNGSSKSSKKEFVPMTGMGIDVDEKVRARAAKQMLVPLREG